MGLISGLLQAFTGRAGIPLLLVTFDALGTLYKFRKPVANQYLDVARQCGLKAKIDPEQLDQAFKQSFKHRNSEYPNYGKGKLDSPEIWWDLVITRAFGKAMKESKSTLPPNLGSALYKHFSSGAAYEPFPDVKPFLRSIRALKRQFRSSDGPMILTGVVTNSDPRVKAILQNMGFQVGPTRIPSYQDIPKFLMGDMGNPVFRTMYHDYYNLNNDFDIVGTSYEAGREKPDRWIWAHTELLCKPASVSRGEQNVEKTQSLRKDAASTLQAIKYRIDDSKKMCIHIGDDYEKDYLGAQKVGWDALLLAREDRLDQLGDDVKAVRSLDEVAMIVNIMANEHFEQATK
ncbi:hypothetical protein H2200_006382 [Cladophialophora chaetospira]|uniref:Haloacid dehalogenase-like hydrolase n=1 Tax=Cladophialophora chaetospira TaxID=386627 RepID=A0AA38X833_9EURO|nr:hypothetical protein H2200_006382 [Cladophialophora chaetospira]